MKTEIFETEREFNNKYPSKLYICSNCNKLTPNKLICINCGWRADGLFKTNGQGYKYIIKEISSEEKEIFKPVEIIKEL